MLNHAMVSSWIYHSVNTAEHHRLLYVLTKLASVVADDVDDYMNCCADGASVNGKNAVVDYYHEASADYAPDDVCVHDTHAREPHRSSIQDDRLLHLHYSLVVDLLPKQVRGPVREVEQCEYEGEGDP